MAIELRPKTVPQKAPKVLCWAPPLCVLSSLISHLSSSILYLSSAFTVPILIPIPVPVPVPLSLLDITLPCPSLPKLSSPCYSPGPRSLSRAVRPVILWLTVANFSLVSDRLHIALLLTLYRAHLANSLNCGRFLYQPESS